MRTINKIVIHHSAVLWEQQQDTQKMIQSMSRTHAQRIKQPADKNGSTIAYHFFIGMNWELNITRDLNSPWWANSNLEVNNEAVNICVHGNFDIDEPNEEQKETLRRTVEMLLQAYPNATIHWHRDFANKTCPWNNFDIEEILDTELSPVFDKDETEMAIDWAISKWLTNWENFSDDFTRFLIVLYRYDKQK